MKARDQNLSNQRILKTIKVQKPIIQQFSRDVSMQQISEPNLILIQIESKNYIDSQITLLISMQNKKTEYSMLFYDHASQFLATNWYYYSQYSQIQNNFPLYIFPSTAFPQEYKTNLSEMFSFPSTIEENCIKKLLQSETDNQKIEQKQKYEISYVKNLNKTQVEQKKKQERRKKINELQNIKDKEKDRNILSNSLKLFLKYLRTSIEEPQNYQEKIIKNLSLNLNILQFNEKINQVFPTNVNYVRPYYMKNIIQEESSEFSLLLKISLKYFFKQEIYLTNHKPTKIRRSIRNQQIKAGRKLLQYFFGGNQTHDQ